MGCISLHFRIMRDCCRRFLFQFVWHNNSGNDADINLHDPISGKQLPVKWLSCFILFGTLYISLMMHAMNINNKSIESEMENNLCEPNAGIITVRYAVFASDYHISKHGNCVYINSAPYSLVKVKPFKMRCKI